MAVNPIPDGYHSITPYLIVKGAAAAIDFYVEALGAKELFRMGGPGGKIGHAELELGDSRIMLADEHPERGFKGPASIGGSAITLVLYVDDVDGAFERAVRAGAQIMQPLQDQFYGDRSGTLTDPFGHIWNLSQHVEDVPPDELARRAEAAMKEAT